MSQPPPPPHQPYPGSGTPQAGPPGVGPGAPSGYPPPAPQPGGPHPGGGGGRRADRRRRSSRRGPVVGGVVAVALLLVGGVWFATKDGDDGDKGGSGEQEVPQARILNKVPMPKGLTKDPVKVAGLWTTDKNFVKGDVKKIVGYPLSGGAAEWEIPLAGQVCYASPHVTDDGLTAILFEEAKDNSTCTQVGLVDLKKHKLVWQRQAKNEYGSAANFDEVTIGGGTVAAGASVGDGGAAWSLDGKPLWQLQEDEECQDIGYGGGADKLVAVRECGDADPAAMDVQTIDPKTRKAKSTYKLPAGVEGAHVISTDPLVIGIEDEKKQAPGGGITDVLAIDDSAAQGELRSTISIPGKTYDVPCSGGGAHVDGCDKITVSKTADAVFLSTAQNVDAETYNEVVAFDLKTGKEAKRIPGAESATVRVLGIDTDGSVIAYQDPELAGDGGAIWSIDPKSYKKTKLLQNRAEDGHTEDLATIGGDIRYANKRLYLGEHLVSEPDASGSDGGAKTSLAIVIGTS
ncbi:PQQ-binding-like beta-propeller repeat protein [Streptomyces sp. P1-3]|uniref:outer membrane protein assembly factor BamB family protein n=1 Tax=Streptomyces sp. P1-3 TaxID=3421658 RepID=UPI003D35AC7B